MARKLGNVAVGTVLKLNENGSPQNYIVVHQGLPASMYSNSCNGTWLLRQDIYSTGEWGDAPAYSGLIKKYDSDIQSVIKTVKVPYHDAGWYSWVHTGEQGYQCQLFSLSNDETGDTGNFDDAVDGTKLSYFISGDTTSAKNRRLAKYNGRNDNWWTRSPMSEDRALYVSYDGAVSNSQMIDDSVGYRPAMVMPQNLIVDDNNNILADTYPDPPATITVPTEPVPTGSTIPISWAAVTGATYKLQRSVDGGSWMDVYTGGNTSYNDTAGVWNQVKYQVASVKSGITSGYTESTEVQILPYTVAKITAPSQVMEGQQVPVSWSSVAAANTYVLERRTNMEDWVQIYSGADTQFTDTPEAGWTSVQYRVKAGKDGTYGGYTTSLEIPVISASVLVISGQDGDLGLLTADVPYTVSSDTGNPITVERYVNGILVTKITVGSGFAYSIPVMELPTGVGSIKLVCSVTPASGGPVTATRIWSYTKIVVQFPDEGGPAILRQEGKNVLPITLAECVKLPVIWGGSLDKGLELLAPLLNTAVMAAGSYTGTGTFGQDSPNELSFSFDLEMVLVSGASGSITISSKEPGAGESSGYIQGRKAIWYSTSAAKQFNVQGALYSYWAVGKAVQT